MTAIDLDHEYDNRGRVPEHPVILAGWARDAAEFRRQARGELQVPYGPGSRQRLDLFYPSGAVRGAVMFIHGGYWQSLGKDSLSHMAKGLVEPGIAVAMPGYDLCPQVRVAEIVEQIAAAAVTASRKLQTPMVVAGHSAGGHLAAEMMLRDWSGLEHEMGFDPFPAAYPVSGLFDLRPLLQTRVNIALQMDQEEAMRLSPVLRIPARRKRILAVVGSAESSEYHRQSSEFCEAWSSGGMEASCEFVAGANHFTIIAPLADPASRMVAQVLDLAAPERS